MKKKTAAKPAKKHHRVRAVVALAALAGAAYGMKKYADSRRRFTKKDV